MIETLQSLRFIFMMMIFMSHFAYRDIGAFDAGGDCGVSFFFLLSGFVCSLGYSTMDVSVEALQETISSPSDMSFVLSVGEPCAS